MTDIDYQKVIGIAHELTQCTPPRAPDGYTAAQREAYYAGWWESTKQFEESLTRKVQEAVGVKGYMRRDQ